MFSSSSSLQRGHFLNRSPAVFIAVGMIAFKASIKSSCMICLHKYGDRRLDFIEVYTGIDRVDNSKGYIPTNVVPCCGVCNFMKGRLGLDIFLTQIKRIHANLAL